MAVKRIKNHSSGKRQTVVVDYKSILTTSKPEKFKGKLQLDTMVVVINVNIVLLTLKEIKIIFMELLNQLNTIQTEHHLFH